MEHKITLAGNEYPIGAPVFKQMRVIIPAVTRLSPKLGLNVIDEAAMDDMFNVLLAGLQAGNAAFTREQLEAIPLSATELVNAMPVIMEAAGLEVKPQGEAKAGN